MKNEKLELLLNKVVEFNQPDVVYYKGFLYKSTEGYYIKVVDSIIGSLLLNDKVYLKDGDEKFITQADKPKLMRVSLKSWHYRLVKFVLGSNAPTPKTMQNGCPYFWLLMFSMFTVSFILLGKLIKTVLMLIPKLTYKILEILFDKWIQNMNDETAYKYDIYGNQIPLTSKLYINHSDYEYHDFIYCYIVKKYNINPNDNWNEYIKLRTEIEDKYRTKRNQENAIDAQRRLELKKKQDAAYKLQLEREAKWEAKMKPIKDAFNKLFSSIAKTFTFNCDWKNIIKRTKQIFGAIITVILLIATFIIVNLLVLTITEIIDLCIVGWTWIAGFGIILLTAGIIIALIILIASWVQKIIDRYNYGNKVWYVQPFIYLIFYPIKYAIFAISYAFLYAIWIPIKFIFYTFIFKLILKNVGILVWKALSSLWKNILSSTGVFGEYFGASYSDYCPGIEWTDVEDEDL